MVSILCVGDVPFILRKREASAEYYYLVEEFYIDGMLEGAALELGSTKRTKLSIHQVAR